MRPRPEQLDTTGATADKALVYDPLSDEYKPGTVVRSVGHGPNVSVDNTDPARPVISVTVPSQLVPLSTVINGVAELVFDADGQVVMTENA